MTDPIFNSDRQIERLTIRVTQLEELLRQLGASKTWSIEGAKMHAFTVTEAWMHRYQDLLNPTAKEG